MINERLSDFTILAIETSCDETAAAVVRGGRTIVTNVVASQIDEHRRFGGIVPEVASRQHVLTLPAVIEEALAGLPGGWDAVDAVAATYGPGLSGALLTGLNAAKAMAWARDLPFVGVNHLEAHIYANWLIPDDRRPTTDDRRPTTDDRRPTTDDRPPTNDSPDKVTRRQGDKVTESGETLTRSPVHPFTPSEQSVVGSPSSVVQPPEFPLVALVVSGGHTLLALLESHGCYRLLGQTRDDAAGEAFDKAARIMGLGFPGGPAIQRAAERAAGGVTLPRAWLRDSYDFSFSGLKTAVLHQVQGRREREAKATTDDRRPTTENRKRKSTQSAGSSAKVATTDDRQRKSAENAESNATESANPKSKTQNPQSEDRFIAQLASAFQESVVDVLVTKTIDAARAFGATEILLAGGVAANARLREELQRRAAVPVRYPPLVLCTDNAAMIAAAAFYRFDSGLQSGWDLDVAPNLKLT